MFQYNNLLLGRAAFVDNKGMEHHGVGLPDSREERVAVRAAL